MSRKDVLITAEEVAARLDKLVLIDVGSRDPERNDGLVGAHPAELATDFAGAGGGTRGSRPLPEIVDLQAKVRRWGIDDASEVVVYDDKGGLQAARAWWTLKWAGLRSVRLLDGGYQAAVQAGVPTAPLAETSGQGTATLSGGHLPTIDADEAASRARRGRLIDARAAKAFDGDPVARSGGHIQGSINLPASGNLADDGRFLSNEALAQRFGLEVFADTENLAVTCGAGVSAAHDAAALAILGVTPALFVGSWSAWSADPARPVAYGAPVQA